MKKYPEPKDREDYLLHEQLKPIKVSYVDMTLEKRLELRKKQERLLENGVIDKKQFNKLISEYPLPDDKKGND